MNALRPSGYFSRWYELGYGQDSPLYDWIVAWGMLPLGGEPACRRQFARWCAPRAGDRIASLCCGTGRNERALVALEPDVRIVAVDLGTGQLARARREDRSGRVDYRRADASKTGLPTDGFDGVLIALALHEMPRDLRLRVLSEAARICRPGGRITAIEHGTPAGRLARFFQWVWWFYWLPGNPESRTSHDMQRRGLANEFEAAGIRVLERHATRPDWVEAIIGTPARDRTTPPAGLC